MSKPQKQNLAQEQAAAALDLWERSNEGHALRSFRGPQIALAMLQGAFANQSHPLTATVADVAVRRGI